MRNVNKNSNQLGKELFIANYEIDLPVPKHNRAPKKAEK